MERNLVPFEVAPEPLREELREVREEKFEEALRSLVTGTTPRDVVFQRPARGGVQVDYVPGWWFIEQLNSLFGYCWDLEVLNHNIEWKIKQIWVLVRLTVHGPDGATVSKTSFGSSDIKFYREKPDQPLDIADDLKAAVTDGMKKAATMFGLASDVYGRREVLEQTGPGKAQMGALYRVGEKVGMTRDQVDDYCMRKHDKLPTEMETIMVLSVINELRGSETKTNS